MRHAGLTISATTLTLCLLMSSDILASTSDVDDLVGARASSGESELEDRGYYHRKNLTVKNGIIGYWWNPRRSSCIAVTTSDGRYKSILSQPEVMCDDEGSSSSSHSSSGYGSSTPEIRTVDNGNIAVDMGGCNVLFDRRGDILNKGSSCSRDDVREATDAYDSHMREQGAYAGDEAPPGGYGSHDSGGEITCESKNNQYQFCRIHIGTQGRVRLTKRLSSSRCEQGVAWDYEQDGIWVDKGCRARFSVEP